MSLNTLNLKQKQGGRVIKQADRSSTFKFALQDSNGALINLDGQTASISLHNPNSRRYWETTASVRNSEVEFKLPGNLANDDYILEITVGGYVFPSDNDFVIEVVKGYKNLTDKQTAESYKKSIKEITQEVQREADKKLKDTIALIGTKKDRALKEIDGQVKIATNKYLNDKVDKVAGKQLSDNNYTNQDKAKVDSIKDPWEIIDFGNFCKDKFGTETMDDTVDNWLKISSGYYYVRFDNIKNQPSNYGLMRVINVGSIDVIWETMNIGLVYRKSGDKSGISKWKAISQ